MILVWLIALPIVGGFLAWAAAYAGKLLPRLVSLITLGAGLALTLPLLRATPRTVPGAPGGWLKTFNAPWIPSFGIDFRLGLDGMSWLLIVLTFALGLIAVFVAWREADEATGFFHANLLWSIAGSIGVFLALDLFLFFFFWELMLVPMYFVIAIWGHEARRPAAIKFFLFTQGSGLLMLVAILALVFMGERQTGQISFDYFRLIQIQPDGRFGAWVMFGFFAAFAVKLAVFPVHSWLPQTHTQAPTAGSVILASILLKTGGYGLLRFTIPLFGTAAHQLAPVALWLGVISIFYGAILAFGQSDLKKLVAFSSISHMGFVLIGIFSFNNDAWQGAIMLMVAHGVSTGALFIVVGSIQHRLHSRDLGQMGGLWTDLPRLSSFGTFFVLASMGLPGLGNFIGEFLILRGTFEVAPTIAVLAATGLIPAALYSLVAIQRGFHGGAMSVRGVRDYGAREISMMLALAGAVIWLGIYPQPLLDIATPGLANLLPAQQAADRAEAGRGT